VCVLATLALLIATACAIAAALVECPNRQRYGDYVWIWIVKAALRISAFGTGGPGRALGAVAAHRHRSR